MKYFIREPRELQRTVNKALQEDYIWDLVTYCHGPTSQDMTFFGTLEQCQRHRLRVATMLRKVADEVEQSPIEETDDDTDFRKGINVDYGTYIP